MLSTADCSARSREAFEAAIFPSDRPAPLLETICLRPKQFLIELNCHIDVVLERLLRDHGIPRDVSGAEYRAWLPSIAKRLSTTDAPPDEVVHTKHVEDIVLNQATPWLSPPARKVALESMVGAAQRGDAEAILKCPHVQAGLRERGEFEGTPDALGLLFDDLASPDELRKLDLGRRKRSLRLADKIKNAQKRAKRQRLGEDFKIGTGNERRRPAALPDDLADSAHGSAASNEREVGAETSPTRQEQFERIRGALTRDQLEALLAVARTKSLTKAAHELGKSPQAIHQAVGRACKNLRKLGISIEMDRLTSSIE